MSEVYGGEEARQTRQGAHLRWFHAIVISISLGVIMIAGVALSSA